MKREARIACIRQRHRLLMDWRAPEPRAPAPKPSRPKPPPRPGPGPGLAKSTVLRAACSLPQPFRLADLVVAAWRLGPELFGLAGYESLHPDAKRVEVELYGARGLVARGLLRRLRPNVYQVVL